MLIKQIYFFLYISQYFRAREESKKFEDVIQAELSVLENEAWDNSSKMTALLSRDDPASYREQTTLFERNQVLWPKIDVLSDKLNAIESEYMKKKTALLEKGWKF